jgi:hypothetical protein
MENAFDREEMSAKQVQQTQKLYAVGREEQASSKEKDLQHKKNRRAGMAVMRRIRNRE